MERNRKVFWGKTAVLVAAVPIVLWAYEYGPDPGYVGVPGENGGATCTASGCHTGTTNNPANQGSVTVNFPGGLNYTPGVKQHLSVTIADPAPSQKGWGFELTARSATTPSTMAGTFGATDTYTQLLCSQTNLQIFSTPASQVCPVSQTLQYIEHSLAGFNATLGPGSATYQFDWTPPATSIGNITIYVAGNAGVGIPVNQLGNHIYAKTYTLTAAAGGGGNTPTISEVDNAYSNSAAAGIQSGNWVAIKGTNLSNTNPGRGWNANENFPTSMDGTSVTINGKTAFVYYISPTQVNVQAPTDAALGPVNVVVTNNSSSASATAQYQTNSPALLQWGGGQYPYALITNGSSYVGNPAVIANTVSAHAGDALTLWATGLGPTTPAFPAGQQPGVPLPTVSSTPTITVGGASVTVLGAVLRYAGLYQVNIQLPASLPTGDQPIEIIQGSFQSPAGVLIHIQ